MHVNHIMPYTQQSSKVLRLVVIAEESDVDKEVEVLRGGQLTAGHLQDLVRLKERWKEILIDKPCRTHVLTHSIDTGECKPVRSHPYLISPTKLQGVKTEIQTLVQMGILVPSYSPWSSPIVPIVKPDGSIRLCVNYRRVNAVTVPDPYYMPLIEELIAKVGESNFLTKLDLAKGFYQVELEAEAQAKTAFVSPVGKFQFTCMPFGLRNARLPSSG